MIGYVTVGTNDLKKAGEFFSLLLALLDCFASLAMTTDISCPEGLG
jgi:hypothetical protein